jgi:hypothetical protein
MSGFMGALLGGNSPTPAGALSALLGVGPQRGSQTTTATAPPSVQRAREELIARTSGFAAEPFQPYVDASGRAIPRVAGFTPDQQRAFEATRGLATQAGGLSALTPELTQQGIAASRRLATTLPETDLTGYMSPYTQAVLEPAIRDLEERAARERLRLGQQSARTGSFGGSRQAIAESELERGTQREIGDLSARQRAAAYNQALEQFRADQQRIPALYAGMQSALGTGLTQTQGALGSMVNPLLATGGLQQAREQAVLDIQRQQFEEERDFPLRGINALRQTLGLPAATLGVGERREAQAPGRDIFSALTGLVSQGPSFLRGLGIGGSTPATTAPPGTVSAGPPPSATPAGSLPPPVPVRTTT